eukprot:Rmarinus@m.18724
MGLSQNMGYGFLLLYVVQFLTFSTIRASTTECSEQQELQYLLSVVDIGVLSAGGCDSLLSLRPSQDCCDTAAELASNPCLQPVLDSFDINLPLVNFVMSTLAACRLEPGVGYIVTGCPDGVVTGEEQCDDGNAISGDGCSSYCFVEDGYDCFPDNNGTSICWQCEEECFLQNKEVCASPGGPCGDCLDGFGENNLGYCAAHNHVHYAAITAFGDDDEADCLFHDVGFALEETPVKSSKGYLDAIRMWSPNRSDFGTNVTCSLKGAMARAPTGDDVVLVLEVFLEDVKASGILLGTLYSESVVVFSDIVDRPTLHAAFARAFEVFPGSYLYVDGVTISECRSSQGSVVRNFGVAVFDDVIVSDCVESSLEEYEGIAYQCGGILASSFGYISFRNSLFTDSTVRLIADDAKCLDYQKSVFTLIAHVRLSNVTFSSITTEGYFMSIEHLTDWSLLEDIHFSSVNSGGPILDAKSPSHIRTLTLRDCKGAGGLLLLSQTTHITSFEALNNTVDEFGVIFNLGKLFLSNGVIAGTTGSSQQSRGAIVNRGELDLNHMLIESNQIGALTSSYSVHMSMCEFKDNTASHFYSAVYSTGETVIDSCTFVDTSDAQTIVSELPVILRNTILPADSTLIYVACEETLELADGSIHWPCGFNANCTESAYSGVNCTCAQGHVGSSIVMCGPPAAVHVLPDTDVVGFVTKDDSGDKTIQNRGILSDGLGIVTWQIVVETLPFWISVSPHNGSFFNDDPCVSDLVDLYITFLAADIRANDTYRTGEVELRTFSTFDETTVEDFFVMSVQMIVEVFPSATTSRTTNLYTCAIAGDDDSVCEVEAGSTVSVVVDLRDSSGYSLGVGGTG